MIMIMNALRSVELPRFVSAILTPHSGRAAAAAAAAAAKHDAMSSIQGTRN